MSVQSFCTFLAVDTRKRKKSRSSEPEKPHPQRLLEQAEVEEDLPPPPKVSKMRSDIYAEEQGFERDRGHDGRGQEVRGREEQQRGGEMRDRDESRGGEVRVRHERPSLKRYEAPSSRSSARKTIRAQVRIIYT